MFVAAVSESVFSEEDDYLLPRRRFSASGIRKRRGREILFRSRVSNQD